MIYPTVKHALCRRKACTRVVIRATPGVFELGRVPAPTAAAVRAA